MNSTALSGLLLLVALLPVDVAMVAQAETELERQGVNPLYGPELKSNDDFRQMIRETLPDLKRGFEKAGAIDLFEEFIKQSEQSDIKEIDVNPGERLQWMISKKGNAVEVIRDVVWVGIEPFAAFLVNVDKAGMRYPFVISAKSGNVSLKSARLIPVMELAPNEMPFCEVAISPVTLSTGGKVIIDASQSADSDGIILSMSVQVEDANNMVISNHMIDAPPFIDRLTMMESGDYSIRVSVSDDKGKVSYSPGCPKTKITVTASE